MQPGSKDPSRDLPRSSSVDVDEEGRVHLQVTDAAGGADSGGADSGGADSGGKNKRKPSSPPKQPRKVILALRWARRISQGAFLVLFFFFLFQTTFRGHFAADPSATVRLPWPVEAFFYFDPFAALLTFLSTFTVYRSMLWALVVVALTLVFGRVFCGWVCPMGTINHVLGWLLPSRKGKGGKRIAANRTHPVRQRVKYYLLYASMAAALAGSAIGGVLDPIALLIRSLGLSVLPAGQYVMARLHESTAQSDLGFVVTLGDGLNYVFSRAVWPSSQFHYHWGWALGVLFVAVMFMNRLIPRFWCRVLCPLGALLGLLSRFALFGLVKRHDKCTDCNLCLLHCQGADSPQGGVKWRQDECHMCLNCESACPEDVLEFKFLPGRESTITKPDTVRRTALATTAAGLAAIPLLRASGDFGPNFHAKRIRPPGSVDEMDFLDRCIRCGECMKVCPNNALHPALGEAGLEGLWTPILIPRIGYCEESCVLCGQVCPTGAIRRFTEKERRGEEGQPLIKMGTAFYDFGRCLPWAMQIPCIVCEEFCPTSPKAIWVEKVEVPLRESKHGEDGAPPAMTTVALQRPRVDPSLCIGCGACEKVCPVIDEPAITVSSVGESRSKTNVILLQERADS
jgi:polyferredoxin